MYVVEYYSAREGVWKPYKAITFYSKPRQHNSYEQAETYLRHLEVQHPHDVFRVAEEN